MADGPDYDTAAIMGLRNFSMVFQALSRFFSAHIGISLAGMTAAALGHITPVEGALLQEAIDVAVILNALRALGEPIRARRWN